MFFSPVEFFQKHFVPAMIAHKRWWLGLGVCVAILSGLGALFAPAPMAFGAFRGRSVEIYRNAEFRVYFHQPMNKKSVEQAFQLAPAIPGIFRWQGNRLAFRPDQVLDKGQVYELTIFDSAKNLLGKKLREPFRQTFLVLDYPEVAVAVPASDTEVNTDQRLTVLFDHPMRTLKLSPERPKDLVRFSPDVKGVYAWLGTTGFEFTPEGGWPKAQDVTATIPKGTQMADGGSLIEDYTWTFRTPDLRVESFQNLADRLAPTDKVRLTFNYEIDLFALQRALVVYDMSTRAPIPSEEISLEKDKKNSRQVFVTKKTQWKLGVSYQFFLPQGFQAGVGPRGLVSEWRETFFTDEEGFRISANCPDVRDGLKDVSAPFMVKFNNPVGAVAVSSHIKVEPALEDVSVEVGRWSQDSRCSDYPGGWGQNVGVYGTWKPSTRYTITLDAGLRDRNGQTLGEAKVFTVETAPYRPSATFATYANQGVLDAYLPRVYQLRTRNMTSSVHAELCSGTFEEYAAWSSSRAPTAFSCAIRGSRDFDPQAALNAYKVTDIDLDELAQQKLPVGFYELRVDVPNSSEGKGERIERRRLVIADVALTLKRDNGGKMLVWATDMKTGEPVSGLAVRAHHLRYGQPFGPVEAEGITAESGVAMLDLSKINRPEQGSFVVQAFGQGHVGYASTDWDDGISTWNYGLLYSYRSRPSGSHVGYLYTDRAVYRPDQEVFFKGVIRQDRDAQLRLPEGLTRVTVNIVDPENRTVATRTFSLSAFGTFHGSFRLDPSMALGTYTASVELPMPAGTGTDTLAGYFEVREYRRPDFKVEMTAGEETWFSGQTVRVPVRVSYYYGAPLANAKVSYSVTRRAFWFQPQDGEWYSFTDSDDSTCYWYCRSEGDPDTVASGEGASGNDGRYTIEIPSSVTEYSSSARYFVTVTVTDINGRSVSTNTEIPVHRARFYVGARPDYSTGWDSLAPEFDVASVNVDGSAKPSTTFTATLYRRTWVSTQKQTENDSTAWDYQKQDERIGSKSVTTDSQGRGHVQFEPVTRDGEYVLKIEAKDERGKSVSAATSRYIYRLSGGDSFRVTDDHQMKIIQNKADYRVGEVARLAVQTPYEKTKALVTIERDQIREYRVIDLGKDSRIIDIPITEDALPNVYVSVLAVRGGGDKDLPEFRLGYAELQVDTSKKILRIDIKPDKSVYRPRDVARVAIETKNSEGKPVSAEVSLAVVDERVVALLGSIDKNILGRFWFLRSIGVSTSQTLTRLVKKVFFATEGGGGGKGDGGGAPPIRSNLLDTAFWKANIVTDKNGQAEFSIALPDNLTTWQMLAIGVTKDTVVGSAETSIMTRRDLMAEPLLPRILRMQDTVRLGTTVHNETNGAFEATVTVQATNLSIDGDTTRRITLGPKSRSVVFWTTRVPMNATSSKITFSVKGAGLEDGIESILPIYPYSLPEVASASGFFGKTLTETQEIPSDVLAGPGHVKISVAPSVGNGLSGGVDYLLNFEYGCSEQTTSAMLASLVYQELARSGFTKQNAAGAAAARAKVEGAIKKLISMQRSDGGWGFWSEGADTYPHLTSYVFWGLSQAKAKGFAVDEAVLDRSDAFLRRALANPQAMWDDNEKAQTLFALAEKNPNGLSGFALGLYERRRHLGSFSKAFLAMALTDIYKGSSAKSTTLLHEIKNSLVYLDPSLAYVHEAGEYGYYMNTDIRSTALYLKALLRLSPKSDDVERLVGYLMKQRSNGYWESTQNTAMALLALTEYAKAHPIDAASAEVSVFLNQVAIGSLTLAQGDLSGEASMTVPLQDMRAKGLEQQIGLEKASEKKHVYSINTTYYRDIADLEPVDRGFTALSDYYALSDKKRERPLSEMKQGDVVRVRMKLLVPKNRDYVAFEHHLPSGLEALDLSLLTTPQELRGKAQQCVPDWDGSSYCMDASSYEYSWWWENNWKHIELRDDRVFLFADHLKPGVYEYEFLAQAMTPGEYRVPPTRAYEFYRPQVYAHNEGKVIKIAP